MFKKIIFNINKIFTISDKFIARYVFSKLPIKNNWILLESEGDYSDNARAFYDYLLENTNNYKFIWIVSNTNKFKNTDNTKFISSKPKFLIGRKIMWYYAMRSKYYFYTHGMWFRFKREEQTIINMWHGCGFKKLKSDIKIDYTFDYTLVTGPYYRKIHAEIFGVTEDKVLDIGLPRNSLLFEENHNGLSFLNKYTNNNKIIFWLPTYRKSISKNISESTLDNETGFPIFNNICELLKLDEFLIDNNITIIIKIHHLQDLNQLSLVEFKNIIILDNNDLFENNVQLYELLNHSTSLITDYSSISIDYLLLNKPIAYTLDDFTDYENERGFVMDNPLKLMPGHKIYSTDDFYSYLNDVLNNIDVFEEDREEVNKIVNIDNKTFNKNLFEFLEM